MRVLLQTTFEEPGDPAAIDHESLVVHRRPATGDRALVIFVHGLGGHRYGRKRTWGDFPRFVYGDFGAVDVGLHTYPTLFRRLRFWDRSSLEDHAVVLADIISGVEYRTVILAGHSLGGLLCMTAVEYLQHTGQGNVLSRIGGLILAATPQAGSQRVLTALSWLSGDLHALRPHGRLVTRLHETFVNWFVLDESGPSGAKRPLPTWAILGASDFWVDRLSAILRLPAHRQRTVQASHAKIVKPHDTQTDTYRFVHGCIARCLESAGISADPPPPPAPVNGSGNVEIRPKGRHWRIAGTCAAALLLLVPLAWWSSSPTLDPFPWSSLAVGNLGAPAAIETVPVSPAIRITSLSYGETGNRVELPATSLKTWPAASLPKRWSSDEHRWKVDTKALGALIHPRDIPSMPHWIAVSGHKQDRTSTLEIVIAADEFYPQLVSRWSRAWSTLGRGFSVACFIGDAGVAQFVNPRTGAIFREGDDVAVLGATVGAIYAVMAVELAGNRPIARSPYVLLKRQGIRYPDDVWYYQVGDELIALLSDPRRPTTSRIAFQSRSSTSPHPDVFTVGYTGEDLRNLTEDNPNFDGIYPYPDPTRGHAEWVNDTVLKFYSNRAGERVPYTVEDRRGAKPTRLRE